MGKIQSSEVIEAREGVLFNLHDDRCGELVVVRSDVELLQAGEAAEGQRRDPANATKVEIQPPKARKISEVICSQNGLVVGFRFAEADALDPDRSGATR